MSEKQVKVVLKAWKDMKKEIEKFVKDNNINELQKTVQKFIKQAQKDLNNTVNKDVKILRLSLIHI